MHLCRLESIELQPITSDEAHIEEAYITLDDPVLSPKHHTASNITPSIPRDGARMVRSTPCSRLRRRKRGRMDELHSAQYPLAWSAATHAPLFL